MEKFYF